MGTKRILFIYQAPAYVYGLITYLDSLQFELQFESVFHFNEGMLLLLNSDYDIVFLDMDMDDVDATQFFQLLSKKVKKPSVAISMNDRAVCDFRFLLQWGVNGIIPRNASREEVKEACRALLFGDNYFHASFLKDII